MRKKIVAQPTQTDLIKGLLRTVFVQHQEFISRENYGALLRRFALMYRLQTDLHIFTDEEFDLIMKHDLPDFFTQNPLAVEAWVKTYKKYWTPDTQQFIDDMIANAKATKQT